MIHGVVMAGGSGTRFWPISRKLRPKQLLPITGGRPMVTETVMRAREAIPPERFWVVTHKDQAEGVRNALPDVPPSQIIAEPLARNTCACAGLAASAILAKDPDATLVMMPADHDIRPEDEFVKTIRAACASVEKHDGLMVFGIRPTHPATGYGYIRRGDALHISMGVPVHQVLGFREKPNRATAEEFLETGEYVWNSGIFVWRAKRIRDAIQQFEPAIGAGLAVVEAALAKSRGVFDASVARALADAYPKVPSVPVDVGVLERATDVRVIDITYRWSDVGSWDALDDLLTTDERGHRVVAPGDSPIISIDSANCLVQSSEPHAIGLVGVEDLIVVHTPDATLVCKRGRAEDVKKIVDELNRRGRADLL
ncbi:MAG: mannose-1-phosphate guanylyltransferase [Planctomycetes bacterium]|nr:mannose-1-phosphate guanylyltransferase [Planctomycetota bacterium]